MVRRLATDCSVAFAILFLVTAGFVVVLPAMLWFTSWVTTKVPGNVAPGDGAAAAASLVAFLTWSGALVSTLWRSVRKVKPSGETSSRLRRSVEGIEEAVGTSLIQRVIVGAVLVLVGWAYLQLFGWVVTTSHSWNGVGKILAVSSAVFIALWLMLDQTWVSLHPFYRKRIASAFAVRRQKTSDGGLRAVAYPTDEMTPLSSYATPLSNEPASPGFLRSSSPQVRPCQVTSWRPRAAGSCRTRSPTTTWVVRMSAGRVRRRWNTP